MEWEFYWDRDRGWITLYNDCCCWCGRFDASVGFEGRDSGCCSVGGIL